MDLFIPCRPSLSVPCWPPPTQPAPHDAPAAPTRQPCVPRLQDVVAAVIHSPPAPPPSARVRAQWAPVVRCNLAHKTHPTDLSAGPAGAAGLPAAARAGAAGGGARAVAAVATAHLPPSGPPPRSLLATRALRGTGGGSSHPRTALPPHWTISPPLTTHPHPPR